MKKGFVSTITSLFLVFSVETMAYPCGMMGSSAPASQSMRMPMGMCDPMMGFMAAMGDRTSQGKGKEESHKPDQEKETPEDGTEKGT
ncbi:MAG: hypothetical protein HY673_06105 [Chloroflexi bacterium]|nr:hypothetical protein [Chloroflexota bacterium]